MPSAPVERDITLVTERMYTLALTLKNSSGTPVDVTGWTGNLEIWDLEGNRLAQVAAEVVDAAAGKIRFRLPATSNDVTPGRHKWFCSLTPASGAADEQEWFYGTAEVLDNRTR